MKNKTAIGMFLVVALTVAACSDSVGDSVEEVCSSLEDLQTTVNGIAGADVSLETTTIDDVSNALDDVEAGVEAVQSAADDVADSVKSQLKDAFDDYKSAIEGVSGDSSLADAAESVATARSAFKDAWDNTMSELNCSTS